MTHGSLFSGIGGFDLAAEWMGWENKFHCEINPFCQKVLKYHFPESVSYADIKTTDFSVWRGRIDVLSGGFPCQPYSLTGKRKGTEDDRHLFPEMLRAVREVQPRWVVPENVPGIISWSKGLVFDQVQADLESEGYKVFPVLLPACGVGAFHRRERVWFVAHSDIFGQQRGIERVQETQKNGFNTQNSHERVLRPGGFGNDLPASRIFRGTNGVSNGLDRVKALGNAIVPQVVFQIFKAIEEYDK